MIKATCKLLVALVITLFVIEITVRVLNVFPKPLPPLPVPMYRLSTNPAIGYEYRPRCKPANELFDSSHKGFTINAEGFRDNEHKLNKPKGIYRILVLGDSTTAGNGIENQESIYTIQLEKKINKNRNKHIRYEVLNMAVGGYQTMQEIETLKIKGLKYQPDMVIVTFCVNDYDLHNDGGVYEKLCKNSFSWQVINTSDLFGFIVKYSRLAFILYYRLHIPENEHAKWYLTNILKGQSTVRAGLVLLSQLQKEYAFYALLVILPEFSSPFRKYKSHDIHQKVFRDAEEFNNIKIIDLLKSFSALDDDASKFSYDSLHLNEYGHKIMAEILIPIIKNAQTQQYTCKGVTH